MKVPATILAGALVVFPTAIARATDLSAQLNVDNDFAVYVSPSDSTLGTLVADYSVANQWEITRSFTTPLTPGTTQYIHVVSTDRGGGYAMFLGQFNLSDSGLAFGDGAQTLLTGSPLWQVSKTAFGSDYAPTTDEGPNGTMPWDVLDAISLSARFVWADQLDNTVYFSAAVSPVADAATPEPTTLSLLALGGIPLLLKRRRTMPR